MVPEFVANLPETACVQTLGISGNMDLILALYAKLKRRQLASVQLAGPLVCETKQELATPPVALLRMRQCRLAGSLGGWHDMLEGDYSAYALLANLKKSGRWTEHARRLLEEHPAWVSLQFITQISPEYAGLTLAEIVDPRWYIDPRNPNRISKLESYLGLIPRIQPTCSVGDTTYHRRCRYVLKTWKSLPEPTGETLRQPGNFLWRIWKNAGGGDRGDLRASQAFIAFLRHSWMDRIIGKSVRSCSLFSPDALFRTQLEIDAYTSHMTRRTQFDSIPVQD